MTRSTTSLLVADQQELGLDIKQHQRLYLSST
jgi:hypothetical protein